ncbi:flagellin [Cupriavidus gilardii CR3]|uniref:Flagellin n=1 Tax=Cupriavidus gilardii TaxID=82541 RepID=A0A849B394_9BURK|nr:flagellin FliC [Cupriavidus gilardii]ALD92405.1 flagellin [Cupriavidus gilardii CR3]QQE09265.1 flagellin FliC [Cupriavidus sp. ISTL7]KAB0596526.1 flagellin FliC [Cupriavidus gilardii]MCT9016516.1 flagellin FliC [Cupriavidus gilardii]MCT9053061.1 flagellin FliC [Cupriavidus gilardii]
MAQVINTNSLSLMTQNNLNTSQSALNTAIQRLSSGLRINSAKDDAAGQAIANRFTANIRGLTQAQRNANDGISLAQTTEGALTEVNNNLQRIRELSVQAATGSNSASDLQSIQDEIKQRLEEINRVSEQTQFNGVKVLAKDTKMNIQVGANDGEIIAIDLKEITAKTLGLDGFNVSGPKGTPAALVAADYQAAYGATTQVTGTAVSEANAGDLASRLGVAAGSVALAATAEKDENGNWFATVTITAADATEVSTLKAKGFEVEATVAKEFYIALDPQSADLSTPTSAAFALDTANIQLSSITSGASSNPLAKLDAALSSVDTLRSSLGAVQNRFDSVISNLGTTVTNLSASRSRIQDADYATEVSNMTRAQILQQAGTSVLAQANQTTQNVLSLLR